MGANQGFDRKLAKSEYRIINYKSIEQAKDIQFVFNSDCILVLMEFRPEEKIPVQSFINAYEPVEFAPVVPRVLGMLSP